MRTTVQLHDVGLEDAEAHQDLATQTGSEQIVEAEKGMDVVHQRNAVGVEDDDAAVLALRRMPVEELEARDRAADVAEESVQDTPVLRTAGVQRGANFVELEPATGASLGRKPVNARLAVRQGLLLGTHINSKSSCLPLRV